MISLSVSNATLVLGAKAIFRNLNWEIQHDQRVGLIGPNGAGKSSLFKLIIGEHAAEPGGSVIRAKSVTVCYLPQHPELDPAHTAFDSALAGNPRYAEVHAELLAVEERLGDPGGGLRWNLAKAEPEQFQQYSAFTFLSPFLSPFSA